MERKVDKAYLLVVDGSVDVAYGILEQGDELSFGLENHSITFQVSEIKKETKTTLEFLDVENREIKVAIMSKDIYNSLIGTVISANAVEMVTDEETQEMLMLDRCGF